MYHEFRQPIPVVIVASGSSKWPTGKAAAYGFWKEHIDHHVTWHVCFDATGEWWEIENPYVRADNNATWGRVPVKHMQMAS